MKKTTARRAFARIVLTMLALIVAGYVLVCLFMMVVGIVINNTEWFGLGLGGVTLPIALPTIAKDLKEWFL